MVSEIIGEEIVKFGKRIKEIISHPECEVIRQIRFDLDLTGVQDEYCFQWENVTLLNALFTQRI